MSSSRVLEGFSVHSSCPSEKSDWSKEVEPCPQLSLQYTVLNRPPHCTPELGAAALSRPRNPPSARVQATRHAEASRCLLPLPGFARLPFSCLGHQRNHLLPGLCLLIPPHRGCSAGSPAQLCPEQPTHTVGSARTRSFRPQRCSLLVAKSAGITVQTVATGSGPPGPRRPQQGALRPPPPGQGQRSCCCRSLNFHHSWGSALPL